MDRITGIRGNTLLRHKLVNTDVTSLIKTKEIDVAWDGNGESRLAYNTEDIIIFAAIDLKYWNRIIPIGYHNGINAWYLKALATSPSNTTVRLIYMDSAW